MSLLLRDPPARRLARNAWRAATGIAAVAGALAPWSPGTRVFYGGARAGDRGGALVKVKRLAERFPEHRRGFSVVYSLSNAPYLPGWALGAVQRRGVAVVHNQDGVFYPAWFAGDWRAQNARMAEAYHRADLVFWQSEFCRRSADEFLGERRGPGEVLYNAVDVAHFSPTPEKRRDGPFTVLVAGKIDAHVAYRLTDAIRALGIARAKGLEARLAVAGSLDEAAAAAAQVLAGRLGVPLHHSGGYTQAQAPGIYRAADAYLMTKHNDPCPNTVIEAMACGLPVIYSASGGVPELVGEEAGVALPVEQGFARTASPDPEDGAAALLRVAADPRSFAAAARRRAVARFAIEHWLDRHASAFSALVG